MTHISLFLDTVGRSLDALDRQAVDNIVLELMALRERRGRLFIVGSGGGAAHASHAVNDFRKLAGIESYTPSDNVSELTARVNDEGWGTAYSAWLQVSRFDEKDALLVFSVGGGDARRGISTNLVGAMQLAKQVGAPVLAVVGRDGGFAAEVARVLVLVDACGGDETAITESVQAAVWHAVVSDARLKRAPTRWESEDPAPAVHRPER